MEGPERVWRAVELFSGIGGWHAAVKAWNEKCEARREKVEIVRAFDNNAHANRVYHRWHGIEPSSKDIARIGSNDLKNVDLWLMSPPCQPYTAGGRRLDHQDTRAAALLHLIELIEGGHGPIALALENVPLFQESESRRLLVEALTKQGYLMSEFVVSPEEFGIPNRRLRYYLIANRCGRPMPSRLFEPEEATALPLLGDFLGCSDEAGPGAISPVPATWTKAGSGFKFHVVSMKVACVTSCFTKAYFESKNSGGSYVRQDGEEGEILSSEVGEMSLRFFTPREALRLMCFDPSRYQFEGEPLKSSYKLVGNSVNVTMVGLVLRALLKEQ